MSFQPPPREGADAAAKEPPPPLPAALSDEQRAGCLALVYTALKLTLEAKKTLTPVQRAALAAAVARVLAAGPEPPACTAFPLAVAVWLRNKQELGNRLVSTALLAACAANEQTRPFVRQAARAVLKLPTDLTEFLAEYDACAADRSGGSGSTGAKEAPVPPAQAAAAAEEAKISRPACIKKIAADVMEALTPYQAAKYDPTSKIKRARTQLRQATARLAELQGRPADDSGAARPFGKGSFKKKATAEVTARALEKRVAELTDKLKKLKGGHLGSLIRYTHVGRNHELIMGVLRKRYPDFAEEFDASGLPGEFDPEKSGTRIRVEAPPTWEQELSEKGNVPPTWVGLLKARDERGRSTLPYMALLRNLRNILLMGLPHAFLRREVLSRLPSRAQIQGSGQTAASISHTWAVLEKEFDAAKMEQMRAQSEAGFRDVLAYKLLLRRIRRPILGIDDRQVGIIGEFLGEPVWAPCGLKKQGNCFLALNRTLLRDGKLLTGRGKGKGKGKGVGAGEEAQKWLPVSLHPPTPELMAELKAAFDEAVQTAASCAAGPLPLGAAGPAVLWLDLSNPKLAAAGGMGAPRQAEQETEQGKAEEKQETTEGGPPLPSPLPLAGCPITEGMVTTSPGQEVELDEISTHRKLNLELRYFCPSYLDYNVQAYDLSGKHLWNSTYSTTEIKNEKKENCVVHCRDISRNPSETVPALRTLHIDLDGLDANVFAMMVTSQIFSGARPSAASIALRECHAGGAAALAGNHQVHDCKGRLLLAQDISAPLKRGGTTVYACIYRDAGDPDSWLFRNVSDLSLESESRVAVQIEQAAGAIFRRMFQESAVLSSMDANRVGYVRVCQLYQALAAGQRGGGDGRAEGASGGRAGVQVFLSGVRKRETEPSVMKVELTGRYVADLEAVSAAKRQFSGKAVDADASLRLVLAQAGGAPSGVFRVANNSYVPEAALREARQAAGRSFPYATVDARGHIFDAWEGLPDLEHAIFVPGQVESCVTILRNLLAQPEGAGSGAELLVRYVDSFFARGPAAAAAA